VHTVLSINTSTSPISVPNPAPEIVTVSPPNYHPNLGLMSVTLAELASS